MAQQKKQKFLMEKKAIKEISGDTGATGQDGYTPVKGTDYFTQTEINEFTTTITNNVNQNIGLRLDEINGEVI